MGKDDLNLWMEGKSKEYEERITSLNI